MNTSLHTAYQNPTSADQHKFLFRLYFGAKGDPLSRCISRAYLDFSRTLHGIRSSPKAFEAASAHLHNEMTSLNLAAARTTQDSFDEWHRKTCDSISLAYQKEGYANFHLGQAQKWINMTLKYVFVFGEDWLPGYSSLYAFCHVPIDNVILENHEFKTLKTFDEAWSRINDYSKYMAFQIAVRDRFKGSSPLAVEFTQWQLQNSA